MQLLLSRTIALVLVALHCSGLRVLVLAENDTAVVLLTEIQDEANVPGLLAMEIPLDEAESILAVGVRKYGRAPRMQETDFLHLGSLTKAMTATLIAKLIENDVLTWTTTIGGVFQNYTINPAYRDVTVEMLASHRSGFTNDSFLGDRPFFLSLQNVSQVPARTKYLTRAFSMPPFVNQSTFLYSNINYLTLGHMIDVLMDPWESVVRSELWKPLNMTDCGLGPVPESSATSIDNPWPHAVSNGSTPKPIPLPSSYDNPSFFGPAGTVHCRASSYAAFQRLHLSALLDAKSSTFLSAESFAKLHTPYKGPGETYTPGAWYWRKHTGYGLILFHDGTNEANYAYSYLVPSQNRALFSFSNVGLPSGQEATLALVEGAMIDYTLELSSAKPSGDVLEPSTGAGSVLKVSYCPLLFGFTVSLAAISM